MKAQYDVLVVGGGIMGLSSAYYLALKGSSVMVLDQFDVPNQWAASGEHLRSFGLTYGKDVFYTEMAVKSIALWQELDTQSGEKFFVQNGMLELATDTHGYEEQSCAVLKEMRLPAVKMGKEEVRRHYPMINTRAPLTCMHLFSMALIISLATNRPMPSLMRRPARITSG